MKRHELIKKYLDFFKSKGHKIIPSGSLVPENDPTVLFTTAGMHPLVPYLLGQEHSLGRRLANVQKCIRTTDIDEVGDSTHHTFFEMLGNWSLGDYFKKEAIEMSFEFLTKVLKIPIDRLAVTVFAGDENAERDNEAAIKWMELGMPRDRVAFLGKKDNWWGPAGKTGPCGPDTEMFYWKPNDVKPPKKYNSEDKNWVEIWNDVLMQYVKTEISTILVDAIGCIVNENGDINRELVNFLSLLNKKIIVVTNASKDDKRLNVLSQINILDKIAGKKGVEIFTLNKKPDKTNPDYFRQLLKKYNLVKEDIIYIDHSEENLNSARESGILSELYKNNKQITEWIKNNMSTYQEAKQKNVDTGMGVERTVAVLNGFEDNYLTDLWHPILKEIEKLSGKKYSVPKTNDEKITKAMRIIADHIRASVFIISENVLPLNTERGYVLRRLIRRAVRYGRELGMRNFTRQVAQHVFQMYGTDYIELRDNEKKILDELENEENKFLETLEKGMKIFDALVKDKKSLSGKEAFMLYQSFGFPFEMIREETKNRKIKFNEKDFFAEEEKHKELSKTAAKGKFSAGLADHSKESTAYHTATHMLHKVLKMVLGEKVQQMGSNITSERMRFDFSFERKLSEEEIKKIQDLMNKEIKRNLPVSHVEMPYAQAVKTGALSYFRERYPPIVKVYSVGDFSKEICTGPHVKNTK
ncbi:MAG: alanine--tRNA ligase-related protein, partial [Nanoarchaeota archaeon]